MSQTENDKMIHPYRTIFLAEDDVDDQEFLRDALLSLDPAVKLVSFSSGLKFIHHLTETDDTNLPCLIVLDYNIPEINGAEILSQLRDQTRFSGIPKVVWSTSDSELYRSNCLARGAKAYLVKPSSINGITEIAREMLRICAA
ncbi:MAG TPA: response regulator [Flavisolibacter sp.]